MKSKNDAERIIELITANEGLESKQIMAKLELSIGQFQNAQPYVKGKCFRLVKKWYVS